MKLRTLHSHRLFALAMIAVQAATLHHMARVAAFPVAVVLAAIVLCIGGWEYRLSRRAQLVLYLVLAAAFAVKGLWLPLRDLERPAFHIGYPRSYAIAQFLLVVQALAFPLAKEKRLRPSVPFYGAVVMMFAGNVQSGGQLDLGFRILALVYAIVAVMFCAKLPAVSSAFSASSASGASLRRFAWPHKLASGAVLILAVGLAFGTSSFLEAIEDDVERFVFNLDLSWRRGSSPGFPSRSELGSIASRKEKDRERIALRVFSHESREPGYLRARTYSEYKNSTWLSTAAQTELYPVPQSTQGDNPPKPGFERFQLDFLPDEFRELSGPGADPSPPAESPFVAVTRSARVLTDASCGTSILSTRFTRAVDSASDRLRLGDDETLEAPERKGAADYVLLEAATPRPTGLDAGARDACLALPADLDPRIRDLATQLVSDTFPPRRKAAVLEDYFQRNCQYQIGIQIPRGVDPLTYFLTEKPPAHCEYFASAAAVLLRLSGVPCRYVTGFVARERNDLGDYWIARNKDSHAWVEAWDDETNEWFVVEATPPEGIPQLTESGAAEQFWDALKARIKLALAALSGGWPAIGAAVASVLSALPRFFLRTIPGHLLLLLAVAFCIYKTRKLWRKKAKPKIDPAVEEGNRLLTELESRLARLGLIRPAHETLHRFATRLEQSTQPAHPFLPAAAAWLRRYAQRRYSGTWSNADIDQLRTKFPGPETDSRPH